MSSYTTLPTARAVTSSASSTAAPDPMSAENVRANRATATFLTMPPTAGIFSTTRWKIWRPFGVLSQRSKNTTPAITTGKINIPYFTMTSLIASITCVIAGSCWSGPPRSCIILPICGMTKIIMPRNAVIAMTSRTIGYVIALLIFLRMLAFFSCCKARRFKMSSRIPPASPARTMLT